MRPLWTDHVEWRMEIPASLYNDRGAESIWFSRVYQPEIAQIKTALGEYATVGVEWGVVRCEEH